MRSYLAARNLFSFLELCSWVVIVVGAIVAFGGATAGSSVGRNAGAIQAIIGASPGMILSMIGFYGLALVQMGRAGVDTAEYSQQSLDVARQQLEVSRQALQQGKGIAASYAEVAQTLDTKKPAVDAEASGYADDVNRPTMNNQKDAVSTDKYDALAIEDHASPLLETSHEEEKLPDVSSEKQPKPITIPAGKFSGA